MLIKATKCTIIEWDAEQGRAVVINPGETDRLADKLAQPYVDAEMAVEVDDDAAPADDLAEMRAAYQAALGKKPHHSWDADTLKAKIAEAAATEKPDGDQGDGITAHVLDENGEPIDPPAGDPNDPPAEIADENGGADSAPAD
ncbi:hypothetical protein [Caenibius sp. WL]|uniref:hypothetical protein n=1 Tax=Caenibius sp. WL TaxID=2872646 RepID=UPI001C99ED61|nr:hypothetical protein [Caenibius sp. WL]QZP06801.1 hypothetical protein K5X80_08675 [Caenibius sp. WL]